MDGIMVYGKIKWEEVFLVVVWSAHCQEGTHGKFLIRYGAFTSLFVLETTLGLGGNINYLG
jgi:hypothetical protein